MSKFFINRPIFAWVIAIFISLSGLIAILFLPKEQYPSIAPPSVNIIFSYPGASAQTMDENVVNIIEHELIGIEGLAYTSSTADAIGTGTITAVFSADTDINFAQVEVQNAIAAVERKLPVIVRDNGINVGRSASNFLKLISFTSEDPNFTSADLGDYLARIVVPQLTRVDGVGNVELFSAPKAMRIWLDPVRLKALNISTIQVEQAIKEQNLYISGGSIGATPMVVQQNTLHSVSVPSILSSLEDFENIIIKTGADEEIVRLKDIATVEMGVTYYAVSAKQDGKSTVSLMIELAQNGNAIKTAEQVDARLNELHPTFPAGISWSIPFDSSEFVSLSINKVFMTILEAFLLVCFVMILFLHKFRYALIPAIVVPISLLGAMTALLFLGMSINILTMFAMVLVIGIVVDDAIVVVENVERIMKKEGLSPKDATIKAMEQISGAVVGITLILISVFLPMALFQGATGNIYKQFAAVMTVSIGLSGFLALTLTPALCASLLKPIVKISPELKAQQLKKPRRFGFISRGLYVFELFFDNLTKKYAHGVSKITKKRLIMAVIYVPILIVVAILFVLTPSSFLPQEDQNVLFMIAQLDNKTTLKETEQTMDGFDEYLMKQPEVEKVLSVSGFGFTGQGENYAMSFISLKNWKYRSKKNQSSFALAEKFTKAVNKNKSALTFVVNPPPIASLGFSNQLEIVIQDRSNKGLAALEQARFIMMGGIMNAPGGIVSNPFPLGKGNHTVLKINIDKNLMAGNGVVLPSVAQALYSLLGSNYVSDFPYKGQMQRVIIQAQADARKNAADAMNLTVPNKYGQEIPISAFATYEWATEPAQIKRYNGFPALSLQFDASTQYGTGIAILAMEKIAEYLPEGFGYEWTGVALDEKKSGNEAIYLYLLSILAVFLCLAALYESWSLPLTIILVIPLGILGILLGVYLHGTPNDIYFKIGLITIIGLSAKNAILIVEYAKEIHKHGRTATQAAIEAATLRFRPIIMTSFAFIVGAIPLYFASGASSASQNEIGTVVLFGMLIGTFLTIFFVPSFYTWIQKDHK